MNFLRKNQTEKNIQVTKNVRSTPHSLSMNNFIPKSIKDSLSEAKKLAARVSAKRPLQGLIG